MVGRFAPSPSGPLHLGNLRTALVAWLAARSAGHGFVVRMEDLDPAVSNRDVAARQLADLAALGLEWDGEVVFQSERYALYHDAIDRLRDAGLVYRCFCSRRDIREQIQRATRAPQVGRAGALADGAYPGTCRDLGSDEVDERQRHRNPALRLRTDGRTIAIDDRIAGAFRGGVDDVVLARADGIPAYNLAVVVDDHLQGVTQVVRGDDLLSSTPRQLLLYRLLGWPEPEYWHVPLVMDGDVRLAKRDGGVTLQALQADGFGPGDVLGMLARSIGLAHGNEQVHADRLIDRFDPSAIPRRTVDIATCQASLSSPGTVQY